ncbi:hypothetical protein PMAYCL1PPCAC_11481, partial [Pristionchus mayeri]
SEICVYPVKYTTFQPTNHNLRLFRNAKAKVLDISYFYEKKLQAKFDLIARFLESVKFDKLRVSIESEEDCTENFIPALLKDRNLENTQIHLKFFGTHSKTVHNIQRMREFIKTIPKIHKLKLEWIGRVPNP